MFYGCGIVEFLTPATMLHFLCFVPFLRVFNFGILPIGFYLCWVVKIQLSHVSPTISGKNHACDRLACQDVGGSFAFSGL